MKRIAVYSPVGRTGKTGFALALGKEIAKKRRTLYLNLEEYSGFAGIVSCGWGLDFIGASVFSETGKVSLWLEAGGDDSFHGGNGLYTALTFSCGI